MFPCNVHISNWRITVQSSPTHSSIPHSSLDSRPRVISGQLKPANRACVTHAQPWQDAVLMVTMHARQHPQLLPLHELVLANCTNPITISQSLFAHGNQRQALHDSCRRRRRIASSDDLIPPNPPRRRRRRRRRKRRWSSRLRRRKGRRRSCLRSRRWRSLRGSMFRRSKRRCHRLRPLR